MRERGVDPATCAEIEALVATILAAPALRDPADPRALQLADVLGHLERRVQAMLDDAARVAPGPRDVLPISRRRQDDPLAALMALSDEERIALFS